ncbi:MAG: high-molecular-weight cytochrome [Geobacteraceae bacterium]|nr:MAG: high-molecular-weight cytochrome [Geobacteraceae bacterium]
MNRLEGRRWLIVIWMIFAVVTCALEGTAGAIECYQCHGTTADYRPVDDPSGIRNDQTGGFKGNHRTHMPTTVTGSSAPCAACHRGSDGYGTSHMNRRVDISFNINSSPSPAKATYSKGVFFNQTGVPLGGTCSNVNCHFEKPTPSWGGPTIARTDCTTCHNSPPANGAHGKKHGLYFGSYTSSCGKCHPDHTKETNPLAHPLGAGKRPLNVQFTTFPNSGGTYSGDVSYPKYLPSQNPPLNGICTNLYCHSDGKGGTVSVRWSDTAFTTCYSCHRGRTADSTYANCSDIQGVWSSAKGACAPSLTMTSNGHERLVGPKWIRRYPCTFCHNATVLPQPTGPGTPPVDGQLNIAKHVNVKKDVVMDPFWNIEFSSVQASYSSSTKTCYNVYCHSDGTVNPPYVKPFSWTEGKTDCNSCHGHPTGTCNNAGCHDGRTDGTGKTWTLPKEFGNVTSYAWPTGVKWRAAIPMFRNEGAGTDRANSHPRHTETDFSCDRCHAATITAGACNGCHQTLSGKMSEYAHINPAYHVNKKKEVVFKEGGTYDPLKKSCSNTACHTGGTDPVWGGSVNSSVTCLNCHGTAGGDVDTFGYHETGSTAKINSTEWYSAGHGRRDKDGPYPVSGNPPARFSGNACWYCHDNNVVHNDQKNFFRLRQHPQFGKRFDKECVYCHMEGNDLECRGCHDSEGSEAPLLANITSARFSIDHGPFAGTTQGCVESCHTSDASIHKSGNTRFWTSAEKDDVKNQYMMMGVCLQCHDDDSNGKCTSCHTSGNPYKYSIGFRPPGFDNYSFIKPKKARATSGHFGYKHYRQFEASGGWEIDPVTNKPKGSWRGGKFCWDCHDPHGDSNIYMIQKKVATSTDGTFGIPQSRSDVVFTQKLTGNDYAKKDAPFNGICNVCHSKESDHFTLERGDGHNLGRVCTTCHEHRFSDSHASGQSCNSCHMNKPVPRHSGFGLPRDCTKCHAGAIGKRMDIVGQMKGVSHHVQRPSGEIKNTDCYQCHWESTSHGLIDLTYHTGYNYRTYTSVKNDPVDLVLWQPGASQTVGVRPTNYKLYSTATTFLASSMSADNAAARTEAGKINNHCISCHSDQNNDNNAIFEGDCRTPRQYAWDAQSIAARYSQTGTTRWGKYNSSSNQNVTRKDKVVKAFSAHGNAVNNAGGFNSYSGLNGTIPNTRGGARNVQCFDCHSSHGSQVVGTTSSYITFNGTRNGGNLKETQQGKGGYLMSYKAAPNPNPGDINPYSAGAGQCFDCHLNQNSGVTPWGYDSTFDAEKPILGYRDSTRFGQANDTAVMLRSTGFKSTRTMQGGHMKASNGGVTRTPEQTIDGLCTPCHDPHGVSPSLGAKQEYAVPLLKGTWLSSPYREDDPPPYPFGPNARGNGWGQRVYNYPEGYQQSTPAPGYVSPVVNYNIDRNTFGASGRVTEDVTNFAGLCIQCHTQQKLTGGSQTQWKGLDRVHRTVKGWGGNNEHAYTCSKCHAPHTAGLPRLMITNCLDGKHRGKRVAGGQPWKPALQDIDAHGYRQQYRGYPIGNIYKNTPDHQYNTSCHATVSDNPDRNNWPNNNGWNNVTTW